MKRVSITGHRKKFFLFQELQKYHDKSIHRHDRHKSNNKLAELSLRWRGDQSEDLYWEISAQNGRTRD